MKVLMSSNNYMYQNNNKQMRRYDSSVPFQSKPVNNINFTGGKSGFLKKIIQVFSKKSSSVENGAVTSTALAVIDKSTNKINNEFFLKEFGTMNEKIGFRIYSKDGKIIHNQDPKEVSISDKTVKKLDGNVAMFKTRNGVDMGTVLETYLSKATHLLVSDTENKKIHIYEFPQYNQPNVNKAHSAYSNVRAKVSDEIEGYAMSQAFHSGGPVIVEGSVVGPELEKLHAKDFARDAGFNLTELDMNNNKNNI